jgi:hypothetical protein
MEQTFHEGRWILTTYELYGLLVDSSVDLHLPLAAGEIPDLTVRVNTPMPRSGPCKLHSNHFEPHYQRLFWPFAGSAEIFNGQDIALTPFEDVEASIFSFAILGPIIALVLHSRHFLTLHASCASLNGKAVAFMGDKGAGKSTIMAATIAAGHQLVADDIAALRRDANVDVCRHGYPLMKVSDASLAAFPALVANGGEVVAAPIGDKHLVRFPTQPQDDVPILGLFVLTRGVQPAIKRLELEEAYGSLMRFSYPIRFGAGVLNIAGSEEFAAYASSIAGRVPIYRLTVAEGLHKYPETLKLVEEAVADGQ